MRHTVVGMVLAAVSALTCAPAHAQSWSVPAESQRCPSKWGAGDERGSGNHMKPADRAAAAQLIKTGEVIELAHVLNDKMPFFGTRRFDVHIKRTFMNDFSNRRGCNEEVVISEIGQVGTQFDGFAHQTHEDSHYNCFKTSEISTPGRLHQTRHPEGRHAHDARRPDRRGRATRGWTLPDTYEITVEDLRGRSKKQRTDAAAGDAVLINTGWGKLWGKDNARYVKTCPGIGIAAAQWLVAKDPMLLGADNWPVEVAPNPIRSSRCPSTRSRWWSTACTCSRT